MLQGALLPGTSSKRLGDCDAFLSDARKTFTGFDEKGGKDAQVVQDQDSLKHLVNKPKVELPSQESSTAKKEQTAQPAPVQITVKIVDQASPKAGRIVKGQATSEDIEPERTSEAATQIKTNKKAENNAADDSDPESVIDEDSKEVARDQATSGGFEAAKNKTRDKKAAGEQVQNNIGKNPKSTGSQAQLSDVTHKEDRQSQQTSVVEDNAKNISEEEAGKKKRSDASRSDRADQLPQPSDATHKDDKTSRQTIVVEDNAKNTSKEEAGKKKISDVSGSDQAAQLPQSKCCKCDQEDTHGEKIVGWSFSGACSFCKPKGTGKSEGKSQDTKDSFTSWDAAKVAESCSANHESIDNVECAKKCKENQKEEDL